MKTRDLFMETATALDSNRARSLLTVLGIVIGISAVITMTALIGGVREALYGELGLEQARLVEISVDTPTGITVEDVEKLEGQLKDDYECLTGSSYVNVKTVAKNKNVDMSVRGILPKYFKVNGTKVSQGAFFDDRAGDTGEMVVVLDRGAVKTIFGNPDEPVVGKTIQLNNVDYTVVGVASSEVSKYSDGYAYIPFETFATRLTGCRTVDTVSGLAREDADMEAIAESTTKIVADYFNIPEDETDDKMYVFTMHSLIKSANSSMMAFQLLMTSVASISLLVGGIGIMNMMLTNVTERIREIGLRKALGAHNSDITKQFLLEAVLQTITGGVIGIIIGFLAAHALSGAAEAVFETGAEGGIKPVIDLKSVAMATGICVLIGVVFGYYPARRAAKLDPVESLHYQ